MASRSPRFPDFKEIRTRSNTKFDRASIYQEYASTAPYDRVKQFYLNELAQEGWHYEGEESFTVWGVDRGGRTVTLRKGEYVFTLSIEEGRRPGIYMVDYYWRAGE